jgi:hypothetical protein
MLSHSRHRPLPQSGDDGHTTTDIRHSLCSSLSAHPARTLGLLAAAEETLETGTPHQSERSRRRMVLAPSRHTTTRMQLDNAMESRVRSLSSCMLLLDSCRYHPRGSGSRAGTLLPHTTPDTPGLMCSNRYAHLAHNREDCRTLPQSQDQH